MPGYIFSFVTINDNGLIHVKRGEMAFTTFTGMEFTDASRWANGKIPITGDDIIIPENPPTTSPSLVGNDQDGEFFSTLRYQYAGARRSQSLQVKKNI